jgi:hypothetical protein
MYFFVALRDAQHELANPRAVVLCQRIVLFSDASIDGSKFKAVNTRDRNFTQAKMQRRLEQIDESINRYLSQLNGGKRWH